MKKRYIILTVTILLFTSIFATGCTQKQTSVTLNSSTEDDQPYWNIFGRHITKCENGYYCIEQIEAGTNRICYLDNETKNTIPLCSKAECSHTDENCNAYLSKKYNAQQIYYYNGMVYVIYNDDTDGLSYLEQVAHINVNCRTARRKESTKWSKMKQISASFPLTENIYI